MEAREMSRVGSAAPSWVEVGRVARPHGVRGALSVALYGDDPSNLAGSPRVRLALGARSREFELASADFAGPARDFGARVRLRLAGLADRDAAQSWAGASVSIPESALRPLPEGEFYWRELVGARCRDTTGFDLGVVDEIWPTRAHDVLVLREGSTTRLLAVCEGTLVRLDRAERVLVVEWPGDPEEAA